MNKVSIVGASGFTGRELVRILSGHEKVQLDKLYSKNHAGENIADLYPSLKGSVSKILSKPEPGKISKDSDIIFLALPHTKSLLYMPYLAKSKKLIIDLSADYRFYQSSEYEKWYKTKHEDIKNLKRAVYGLPEINREEVEKANLIANPGCYATATALTIYPLLKEGLADNQIYIDAKSGISGAGKKLNSKYLFASRYENVTPYKVNSHRHMGEITEFLNHILSGGGNKKWDSLVFCPHLVPIERGILVNLYSSLNNNLDTKEVIDIYNKYYKNEYFIDICSDGEFPQTKDVESTNNCRIGIKSDPQTGDVIVVTAIDNLVKGASGQAVQNMNIAMNFKEYAGLVSVRHYSGSGSK
ncbi:MAG: N-acetyl-gamma-glutamyl-phosphate reductase [Elusimicrobiota bacterium]